MLSRVIYFVVLALTVCRAQVPVARHGSSDLVSEIVTSRTRAYLSCESGEMVVKLNFTQPFRGVVYADRAGPCRVDGDGSRYYELRISLRGCGTHQTRPRVFVNNIVVRFHKSLELEEDEIKTLECRYPPPLAPPPIGVVAPPPGVLGTAVPPAIIVPRLSEVELLLLICALLFVTLLVLGTALAVVRRRRAPSSGPGSEVTKLSGSTLSMFDPIRIPRATASALLVSGSSSQNETIPSDYPSESPSSLNSDFELETDGRRSETSFYQTKQLRFKEDQQHEESSRFTKFISGDTAPRLPPIYARIKKKSELHRMPLESIPDNELRSDNEMIMEVPYKEIDRSKYISSIQLKREHEAEERMKHRPEYTSATVTDFYKVSTIISEETEETTMTKRKLKSPPAPPPKEPSKLTVQNIDERYVTTMTEVEQSEKTTKESQRPPPKWDVLFRVHAPISPEAQRKLRTLVSTDSVFRSLVEEARTEEELVRRTRRYSSMFGPDQWEVIIRVLSPPRRAPSEPSLKDAEVTEMDVDFTRGEDSDSSSSGVHPLERSSTEILIPSPTYRPR
ncbi:hypothetical protein LAZ67_14001020 [Cordylochernes scorpioides]|uniref:ZP domain-containing protein n=1 Tax=Cordylochernes scorpioides TaxID=51811 RepID=A0ABY6L8I2_9ARAC|nr:hypothetical protein LAZ67_14001020 [Cordylochernes scorpioides]